MLSFFERMNEDDVVQKENKHVDVIINWTGPGRVSP